MMLTIDECLMLNCFLFEKFYLQYALCDFDSISLHYAKLFIRQSLDREQIFDVIFDHSPPPIEKFCLRHWLLKCYIFSFQRKHCIGLFIIVLQCTANLKT